jgi:thiosulfate/3-mercaptopyruvate sulfurtransferase
MRITLPGSLVNTEWLEQHLGQPGVLVLDASWYLADSGRIAIAEHHQAHIPGALLYDIDAHSDPKQDLPHMLPWPSRFAAGLLALGIEPDSRVLVYDGSGTNLSAPRVWWTFRVMGFDTVAVLDGGMQKWLAEGRPVEQGLVTPRPVKHRFPAELQAGRVRRLSDMLDNLKSRAEQVVDARSLGRFTGEEPEPRAGLRGGHIPRSRQLHYRALHADDGTMLPSEDLRTQFEAAGVDLQQPIITTCGSGMSACALLLALDRLGISHTALYDGSWAQYGAVDDVLIETVAEERPPR